MSFEQAVGGRLKGIQHRHALMVRAERRLEREAFDRWSTGVIRHAEQVGLAAPTPHDLRLLKRLAEMESPFSAPQVVRNGWCGIQSADAATAALERLVGNGWIHRALPNREGKARYAFTCEYALGRDHLGDRESWPRFSGDLPYNRFTRDANPLVLAGFNGEEADDGDESGERNEIDCELCPVPDPAAEADLWATARELVSGRNTQLHKIAGCIEGLSPIQCAFAMAIAQCRVAGERGLTHIRGVAEYLGMDYNALRAAASSAEAAIRNLNKN